MDILEKITKIQSEMIKKRLDNVHENNKLTFDDLKWTVLNSKEYVSMPVWYKKVKKNIYN